MTRMLYRVNEVAEMLGIGRSLAYELVGRGDIPSVRVGSRAVRVPSGAVQEFVDGLLVSAAETREK